MRFKVRYQHHDISPEQWAMLLAVRLMQNFTFSPISQISEASWPSAWTWCQGWDSWRGRGHHCCPCLRSGEPSPWEREPREGTAYFATHSGWAGDPNRDAETNIGCAWCQHQDPSGYAAGERLRHNADCVIVFTALQWYWYFIKSNPQARLSLMQILEGQRAWVEDMNVSMMHCLYLFAHFDLMQLHILYYSYTHSFSVNFFTSLPICGTFVFRVTECDCSCDQKGQGEMLWRLREVKIKIN